MFYFGWWDLIPIPGFLLALYAQFKLRSLYAKYHAVPQSRGMNGAEVAQAILDRAGQVLVDEVPEPAVIG